MNIDNIIQHIQQQQHNNGDTTIIPNAPIAPNNATSDGDKAKSEAASGPTALLIADVLTAFDTDVFALAIAVFVNAHLASIV
jgi:hypothetical protein